MCYGIDMSGRAPIRSYRDLLVWQRAIEFLAAVDQVIRRMPAPERYGIGGQLREAARSVSANIAEGFGRHHLGDYLRRLSDARGSLMEAESDLYALRALGLVSEHELRQPMSLADEIGRMLTGLAKKLRARSPRRRGPPAFFDADPNLGPRT